MVKPMLKVLFIGNSHTYVNDMPYMFQSLANEVQNETEVFSVMLALPGITLGYHSVLPSTRFSLLFGDYDYAVIQQQAHPFMGQEALIREAKEVVKFTKGTKTKVVANMTWAKKSAPEDQQEMTDAYLAMAKKYDALLSPTGEAWGKVRKENSNIELFYVDGEHSSPAGAYLTACCFVCTILGKSPIGLSSKIAKSDTVVVDLAPETAKILQTAAFETCNKFKTM